jgi:endonuclease G
MNGAPLYPTLSPSELQELAKQLVRLPGMDEPDKRATALAGGLPADVPITLMTGDKLAATFAALKSVNTLGMHASGAWPILEILRHAHFLAGETQLAGDIGAKISRVEEFYSNATQATPVAPLETSSLEAIISCDKRVDHAFVAGAITTARSVALIAIRQPDGRSSSGTAWLLTPRHLITNWHVLSFKQPGLGLEQLQGTAQHAQVFFDYHEQNGDRSRVNGSLRLACGDALLDYAVLELSSPISDRPPLRRGSSKACSTGQYFNIPQYPLGGPIRFGIRENVFVTRAKAAGATSEELLHYITDTEAGSSGSPVCDDAWQVVGLHHAAVRVPRQTILGRSISTFNEGISIEAIERTLPAGLV